MSLPGGMNGAEGRDDRQGRGCHVHSLESQLDDEAAFDEDAEDDEAQALLHVLPLKNLLQLSQPKLPKRSRSIARSVAA